MQSNAPLSGIKPIIYVIILRNYAVCEWTAMNRSKWNKIGYQWSPHPSGTCVCVWTAGLTSLRPKILLSVRTPDTSPRNPQNGGHPLHAPSSLSLLKPSCCKHKVATDPCSQSTVLAFYSSRRHHLTLMSQYRFSSDRSAHLTLDPET